MEKQLFEQLNELLIKLGFDSIISEKGLVVGNIDLCPKRNKKLLSKNLYVHIQLYDAKPVLNVTLSIWNHEIRIFHSQTFETVEDLEKLLINHNLVKHVIEHKSL